MTNYGQLARGFTISGQYAPARQYQDMAFGGATRLFNANPFSTASQRDLWWVLSNEGAPLLKTGNENMALPVYQRSLVMIQSLTAADPGDRGHQRGVAVNELAKGILLRP